MNIEDILIDMGTLGDDGNIDSEFDYTDIEVSRQFSNGKYLYDASFVISDIQDYIIDVLEDKEITIDKDEVFKYMKDVVLFESDYSKLNEDINNQITEADYSLYIFEDGEFSFSELEERLEELFDEFKELFTE